MSLASDEGLLAHKIESDKYLVSTLSTQLNWALALHLNAFKVLYNNLVAGVWRVSNTSIYVNLTLYGIQVFVIIHF